MSTASEAIRLADEAKARTFAKDQTAMINRSRWMVELLYMNSGCWAEAEFEVEADSAENAIYEAYVKLQKERNATATRVNSVLKMQDVRHDSRW